MRVLSWNILFREREERIDVLAEHIRAIDPDVILVQETSPEHLEQLARAIGYQVAVVADEVKAEVVSTPGIITRLPFTDSQAHLLNEIGERCYWMVETTIDGTRVASMHLQHTHQAGTMALDADYRQAGTADDVQAISDPEIRESVSRRLKQLATVRDVVHDGKPTIFGGDLNFAPDGIEYRTIVGWGSVDTWRVGPRLTNRSTILQSNPLVSGGADGYNAQTAIQYPGTVGPFDYNLDYIFTTPGLNVGESWTVGRPFEDGFWPSDHLGVVVEVD